MKKIGIRTVEFMRNHEN